MGHPRHADAKNSVKSYQVPTTPEENEIRKYHFPHTFFYLFPVWICTKFVSELEPRVTSNARLGFSIFSNPSYFCMCILFAVYPQKQSSTYKSALLTDI